MGDKYYSNSGIIFYLCHLLCNKIQGTLTITSQESIGSHFRIVLPYQHIDTEERSFDILLEGITAKLAIKNPEIEKIICQQLDKYGATYFDKIKRIFTQNTISYLETLRIIILNQQQYY